MLPKRFRTFVVAAILSLLTGAALAQQYSYPPLSSERHKYYDQHPEEFQQLLGRLPRPSNQIMPGAQLMPGAQPLGGTWTSIAHLPGVPLSNPVLLTDGTVLAHVSCTSDWYKLTPDSTGSYINGTWAQVASTTSTYAPRFFGSGVLPDGRLMTMGGEYNGASCGGRTTQGAIYDPVANSWTAVSPPSGWGTVSDAAGIVLANGTYMQTSCCDNPPHAALLDPSTLTWTQTGTGKFDPYDEEAMALLPDGTVLTADAYTQTGTCGTGSERYNPATGAWSSAGATIAQQSDCSGKKSHEVGPLVMRPNGTAVSFSGVTTGTPQTAIYDTSSNTWSAGPNHPSVGGVPYTMADAPAAVLPNGNVLVAMSPSNWAAQDSFPTPTHFFELDLATNTFTQVADKLDAASFASYEHNFLVLPTGQVMAFSIDGPTVQVYTPSGTYQSAWQPTIASIPSSVAIGQTNLIGGTQFNGLTEGAYYGDDTNASTHFPLVRITNNATGHVFYARTTNHSNRSIAAGVTTSTNLSIPTNSETGASTLVVVANGVPSAPVSINVVAAVQAAAITSPTPGSVLSGTSVTFNWTAGTGATQYWLYVGTGGNGSSDIFNQSTGTSLQATVANLPSSGATVYVRLWSLVDGFWSFSDYTYTGFTATKAVLTTPTPGSTLQTSTATFGWNAGAGASQYWLYVGSTGAGSADIFNQSVGTSLSTAVPGIPLSGGTVYVRLWTLLSGTWQYNDYTYGTNAGVALTSPAPGSTLAGSSATFTWTAGTANSQYWLYVGTTPGGSDVYNSSTGTNLSATVNGLPINGQTLYVRLWWLNGGVWGSTDYTYNAATPQLAALTTPTPGSVLPAASSSVTFGWTSGLGVTQYWLYVGSTPGGFNFYNASIGTALSATTLVPVDGRTIYVRLWSLTEGLWQFTDYTYKAGTGGLTAPAPQAILSGSSVTFTWSANAASTQYWLFVSGTGLGGSELYNQSTGTALSAGVTGLPTDGRTIYVRLWYLTGGQWLYSDYLYTASGAAQRPLMSAPAPGATLAGTSQTFGWSAGTGASQYWLYVGSSVGGNDLYNQSTGTNLSAGVNNLPTDGRTLYIRLWFLSGTTWQFNDFIFYAVYLSV